MVGEVDAGLDLPVLPEEEYCLEAVTAGEKWMAAAKKVLQVKELCFYYY